MDPAGCGVSLPAGASSDRRESISVADEIVIEYTRRDAIDPIYEPTFVGATEAELSPSDLVIGVSFGAEAKAYPESILLSRGLVNDTIGGRPVLVSW